MRYAGRVGKEPWQSRVAREPRSRGLYIEGQEGDRKGKKTNSYYCTYTKDTAVRTGIFNRGILRSIAPVGKRKRLSRDSRQTKNKKETRKKEAEEA